MTTLTTCLWFDGTAEQAAEFYAEVLPDVTIGSVSRYGENGPGEPGSAMVVEFSIGSQKFIGLNGGPQYSFSEAISFQIPCEDQAEVDRYWAALTADGGEEGPCAWCKDKFGVSWQVVPKRLTELLSDPDPARAARAMAAMMKMKKIVIADLEAAADAKE